MQVADQSTLSASIKNTQSTVLDTWNQSRSDEQLQAFMSLHTTDFSDIEQELVV